MALKARVVNFIFFLLMLMRVGVHCFRNKATTCGEDFYPCNCSQQNLNLSVLCDGVSVNEIQNVFRRVEASHFESIELILLPNDESIPLDILNRKVTERIIIRGSDRSSFNLTIDLGAFTSSRSFTRDVEIINCNLEKMNFGFLNDFANLESFSLRNASSIHLIGDLPDLTSLKYLRIDHSVGFSRLTPYTFKNYSVLEVVELSFNDDIDDVVLSFIMYELSISPVHQSIRKLDFNGNLLLTRFPTRTPYFPNLETILINSNNIRLLETSSVIINGSKVAVVSAQNNNLTYVQPGAFGGDFSGAKIYLDKNNLKDFTANVYQPLLEKMEDANLDGFISVQSNPFACDCGIAWLIAYNRNLLKHVSNATCGETGARFEDLNADVYMNC